MAHGGAEGRGLIGFVSNLWKRLPENFRWNIEDSFQPEDASERLLPREEPQLEIGLAWYRDIIGIIVFEYFLWLFLIMLVATILILLLALLQGFVLWFAVIPLAVLVSLIILGIRERVEHRQWRILKTNARLIISIPVHGSWPLVDNIELKGLPTVLDTNWSPNPIWRVFQFFTGARDLYISLAAYRFIEGTARVGDSLIIPDVMPIDVFELKRLVFSVPKMPPPPQKVEFPSPQEVIIKESDSPGRD